MNKCTCGLLIVISCLILLQACVSVEVDKGKTLFGAVSDTTLNDFTLVTGNIYWNGVNAPLLLTDSLGSEIWIDGIDSIYHSSNGRYSILLPAGTYTLHCQQRWNEYKILILNADVVKLNSNQKTNIDFYLGYVAQ